ncbi:hypothetical protein FQA39_LY07883 [Lamprigera yunnana]|nr:hypothetical protein FQA39_LY07883 [Lamprigera yunnana]
MFRWRSQVSIYLTSFVFIHAGYIKCILLLIKRKSLMRVFSTLESGIFLPNMERGGEDEVVLIKKWIQNLNRFTITAVPLPFFLIVGSLLSWYYDDTKKWPYGIFWEIINFEVSLVCQTVIYTIFGNAYFAVEYIYIVLLSHIYFHLINLQNCIKNTMQFVSDDVLKNEVGCIASDTDDIKWKYLKKRLKEIVNYHNALFDASKDIDDAFNLCYLVVLVCVGVLMCLLLSEINQSSSLSKYFWVELSEMLLLLIAVYIVCYYCTLVMIQSEQIANSCYELEIVGGDIRFQKALLMIIQRSQKPIVFTAGKFVPLTVITALGVARATYSYYTLMRRMYI